VGLPLTFLRHRDLSSQDARASPSWRACLHISYK
jgi:hypothetical protein